MIFSLFFCSGKEKDEEHTPRKIHNLFLCGCISRTEAGRKNRRKKRGGGGEKKKEVKTRRDVEKLIEGLKDNVFFLFFFPIFWRFFAEIFWA